MIWYAKMQPLSGNQLLELRTSLLKMPLVLRLPRKMHLCRSSSNLPRLPSFLKMLQNHHVLVTFQWMHNPLHLPHKTTSERPKCLRDPQFLTLLTSKCASRHNAVHFFDISTSKSAPRPPVFNTFYFQMCFAPQRHALFQHLNFQKWSGAEVFCAFSLRNRLAPQRRATFHLSSPQMSPHPPL